MTDDGLELSRRQLLAGLGTIGVGSATETEGAGVAACFSDGETSGGNALIAGDLDPGVENGDRVVSPPSEGDAPESATDADDPGVVVTGGDPVRVPSGYTGGPTTDKPLLAVPDENAKNVRVDTVIEAFLR